MVEKSPNDEELIMDPIVKGWAALEPSSVQNGILKGLKTAGLSEKNPVSVLAFWCLMPFTLCLWPFWGVTMIILGGLQMVDLHFKGHIVKWL